jgi:23S rRNA (cytosine1962-C5)-methyltransferase
VNSLNPVITAVSEGLSSRFDHDACRFFHGRGQTVEGLNYLNVDWFKPVLLVTLYNSVIETEWHDFVDELKQLGTGRIACCIVQHRSKRGAPIDILWGDLPDKTFAVERDLHFSLSFGEKQNSGFFLDMAPGRRWLMERADGLRVLNLFAYTCSFSVAAIKGGAKTVMNVDMSKAALNVGRDNHKMNNQEGKLKRDVQFLAYDIFRSWKNIIARGPYDIVVLDPPSRQKGSFMADKDYARVLRRIPSLMAEGGELLACLNAPELSEDFLTQIIGRELPNAEFVERLQNREDFPEVDSQRNLKMLHYRI